jgi:hypothetical protein
VLSGRSLPTFQMSLLPPSSGRWSPSSLTSYIAMFSWHRPIFCSRKLTGERSLVNITLPVECKPSCASAAI